MKVIHLFFIQEYVFIRATAFKKLQEKAREKRIENYGPDQEPEFPPKLEALRDEMLAKVDKNLIGSPSGTEIKSDREMSRIEEITNSESDLLEMVANDMDSELTERKIVQLKEPYMNQPKIVELLDDEEENTQNDVPLLSQSEDLEEVNITEIAESCQTDAVKVNKDSAISLIDNEDLEEETLGESKSNEVDSASEPVRAWE